MPRQQIKINFNQSWNVENMAVTKNEDLNSTIDSDSKFMLWRRTWESWNLTNISQDFRSLGVELDDEKCLKQKYKQKRTLERNNSISNHEFGEILVLNLKKDLKKKEKLIEAQEEKIYHLTRQVENLQEEVEDKDLCL